MHPQDTVTTFADRTAGDPKPSRINCAGRCRWCGDRGCTSDQCVLLYELSTWIVCPECDGMETRGACEPCGCLDGVVEARLVVLPPGTITPAQACDSDRVAS